LERNAKTLLRKRRKPGLLEGRTVAIIGYGSQGHAHALNLRDSGVDVVVGCPPAARAGQGRSRRPEGDDAAEAAKAADVIMILVPITSRATSTKDIAPHMTPARR
jgi:ketol-acid reductoisomerase